MGKDGYLHFKAKKPCIYITTSLRFTHTQTLVSQRRGRRNPGKTWRPTMDGGCRDGWKKLWFYSFTLDVCYLLIQNLQCQHASAHTQMAQINTTRELFRFCSFHFSRNVYFYELNRYVNKYRISFIRQFSLLCWLPTIRVMFWEQFHIFSMFISTDLVSLY